MTVAAESSTNDVVGVGVGVGGTTVVPTDVLEERLVDEEYKIWKKNTPFLYDYVMTHSLEWPSLTCQWLPHTRQTSPTTVEHQLLIGTHTTGEQNYLMVATCVLPQAEHLMDNNNHAASNNNNNANSSSNNNATATATSTTTHSKKRRKTTPAPEYDEERGEMGGFGLAPESHTVGKICIHHKIKHEGEVNRARYMPQNHFIVASRGPNPEVYIFDRSKHSLLEKDTQFAPQGVCVGHQREGYGLVWSPQQEGHLATASEDGTVRLWDVSQLSANDETGYQYKSYSVLKHHTDTVEDVDWHTNTPQLIASVGGDRRLCLWDRRTGKTTYVVEEAHSADINSVTFNPNNDFVLATGSSDKTIGIWDVRRMHQKAHSLENVHVDDVFSLAWAPHDEAILASCSADRRVAIWDLARIGSEQSAEDAQDGPPELLFLHGGHTNKVSDLGWNPNAPWTLASTSEDNILQIWTMAEEIYASGRTDEDDDTDGLGPNELE